MCQGRKGRAAERRQKKEGKKKKRNKKKERRSRRQIKRRRRRRRRKGWRRRRKGRRKTRRRRKQRRRRRRRCNKHCARNPSQVTLPFCSAVWMLSRNHYTLYTQSIPQCIAKSSLQPRVTNQAIFTIMRCVADEYMDVTERELISAISRFYCTTAVTSLTVAECPKARFSVCCWAPCTVLHVGLQCYLFLSSSLLLWIKKSSGG